MEDLIEILIIGPSYKLQGLLPKRKVPALVDYVTDEGIGELKRRRIGSGIYKRKRRK